MFTEAERLRAIELYFKYGRKLGCDSDLVVVVDCQIPADELIVHDL